MADNDKIEQKTQSDEKQDSKVTEKVAKIMQNDPDFLNLKLQHRSFVIHYLATKNATESALKAEYPKTSAYSQGTRLYKNAKIASLIQKYSEMEASLASDEKEKLIEELNEIKDLAKGMYKFSEAISAIKQISAMRGFEAPKEIKTTLSVNDVLRTQELEGEIEL